MRQSSVKPGKQRIFSQAQPRLTWWRGCVNRGFSFRRNFSPKLGQHLPNLWRWFQLTQCPPLWYRLLHLVSSFLIRKLSFTRKLFFLHYYSKKIHPYLCSKPQINKQLNWYKIWGKWTKILNFFWSTMEFNVSKQYLLREKLFGGK